MSKHTPGPWQISGKINDAINITHPDASEGAASWILARVICRPSWEAEQTANARLIAAAPELLEALEVIAADSRWTSGEPTLLQVRAAIAKAKGEA